MKKHFFILSLLISLTLGIGQMWAVNPDVTYDFTGNDWSVSNGALTNGTVSFTGEGGANFKMNTGYFMMGKSGAYITFPTYESAVEKIVVTGRSGASTSVGQNIFVGNTAVSTATTGAAGTNTYEIASNYQAAGTTYILKVTTAHNTQITKIEIYYVSGEDPGDEPGDDPTPSGDIYELVTSVDDLAENDEIIIVNTDNGKAISTTQNSNNRGQANVTISNDAITPGEDVQILTLGISNEHWTLYTGSGYLYASSSSSNQLKTQATNNANGEWTISIANKVATITAQGSNTRNVMQYNSGSSLFACYASASMQAISIFKKSDGKQAAGLAYAEANQKNLIKLGEAFTAPTLQNPNSLTGITYASNNTAVAEVASNGTVTIKAAGVAVITASFAGNDNYKAGSASYTIGVTAHAGTELDPYDVADAKVVIDVVGTKESAYVAGLVSSIQTTTLPSEGYITFFISADGATSGQQLEAYKCKSLNGEKFSALSDVETGASVVITGTLKKYNSTYEFDQNCRLVSYEAPTTPKQSIANDQANPYTVAQAITYAADGVTYDLDDYVYVRGVVYDVKSFSNGAMNIFVKDANAENQFEFFKCAGINDGSSTTPFEALTDVQEGDVVIGYGQLTVYNSVYEFKQGNYLVDLDRPTPTPPASENVVILAEYNSKYYAMSTTLSSKAFTAIEVEKDGDKIVVASAEDKAAIQWSMIVDGSNTTFQTAAGKYLAHTGTGTDLTLTDAVENWSYNSDNGCYSAVSGRAFFYNYNSGNGIFKNYSISSNLGKTGYSGAPEIIEIAAEDIVITSKADPALAYTPASATITIGGSWSAPELTYANGFDGLAAVTYASNKEAVATVSDAGVIALAGGTGTAVITASFAGNASYRSGAATYTITVNEAGDDLSGTWALVTDEAQLAAGKKVVIAFTGVENENLVAKTMGAQNSSNRAAVASSVESVNGTYILTPAEGTKVFTLVNAGEGMYAFQATNNNYLYASSNSSNQLKETDVYTNNDNAKWAISFADGGLATIDAQGSNSRKRMRYNPNNGSPLFACYATDAATGSLVTVYMLQEETPVEPDYTTVREELTIGKHYTICLKKQVTAAKGGTFWTIGKRTGYTVAYLEEAPLPLTAGEPFIFQATADKLEVVYEGEDASEPAIVDGNALRGTFEDMNAEALEAACTHMYMLHNNQICPVNHSVGANSLAAFRAYIDDDAMVDVSTAPQPAPGRQVKSVPMQGNVATGVDNMQSSAQATKMLIDGRLFIIRGEKIYDVTGSLVK